jgi:DNA-nicking Smr family endonuclease
MNRLDSDPHSGDRPEEIDEVIEHSINDELDLHTFRPNEIGSLLPEYFRECRMRGILSVRVIHGKGTGTLREGVHRLLDRLPEVLNYRSGDETSGSWGATLVDLAPWSDSKPDSP